MKKTKGLVMRTSPKVTGIFTEEGDFIEIPTPKAPPVVGQTIEVTINPRRLWVIHNSVVKYASVAAVLFLVLSISVFYLFIPNMAVASVSLDINKGIEILVNKDGKVIKVQEVKGGSDIVEGLSIKGLDVYQAVDLIIGNAHHKGTFNETHNLILASVLPVNRWGNHLIDTEKLKNSIRDEMTSGNMFGTVVVSQANQKIQQAAKQQGMTVNGYLIYARCEEQGLAVQPDTLRNDAQRALVEAKVSVASLFPEESFEVSAHDGEGNSPDTQREPNLKHGPEYQHPLDMELHTTGDHSTESHVSPDHSMPGPTTPLQPTNPPHDGEHTTPIMGGHE